MRATTHPQHRPLTRAVCAALCAVGLLLAGASPALAQEDVATQVEELSAQGVEFYSKGRYNEAIASFERAYRLAPVANLLYNIALSWEKLGNLENAVKAYERFIVADDADPGARAKALARIKELDEEIERKKTAAQKDAVADKGTDTTPDAGAGAGDGGVEGDKTPPGGGEGEPKVDEGGMGTLALSGIVTAGVGVALVGTGVFFGLQAADDVDSFEASRLPEEKDSFKSDAESDALLADIFYGVGGAAIAAGIVMIVLDSGGGETAPAGQTSLTISPMVSPSGAGASVLATF